MKIAVISILAVLVVAAAAAVLLRSRPADPPAPVAHAAETSAPKSGTVRLWSEETKSYVNLPRVAKTEAEWRQQLTKMSFHVLREAGTERAFSGAYARTHDHGLYRCAACGTDLFHSDTKFESGTGWPSFWKPVAPENVEERVDSGLFGTRTEVLCARCGGHLGHVFTDGPKPTGLRYCMNSAALEFVKR
jgi:peptide-methionine (R)-S-oxide reductase